MYTRQYIQRKAPSNSSSTPAHTNLFRQRPFNDEANQAVVPPQQEETPDLQTQLERAARFGHNFGQVKVQDSTAAVIQPKLAIGAPGDKYEQEADSVAAQVMSMAAHGNQQPIQRDMAPEQEDKSVQTKPLASSISPLIQREAAPEEEQDQLQAKPLAGLTIQREAAPEEEQQPEQVQAKPSPQRSAATSNDTSDNLENQLTSSKGGGSPLPDNVRSFMEPRFGADFSQVRVHTDSQAVQMNQAVGAQAFTHGSDIYYGSGKSPAISDLTAHELTHVVQQTGGVQRKLPDGHAGVLKHHQAKDRVVVTSELGTPQVQKSDPVSAASLGVAVFEAGRSYANSGTLYHNGNTPSYMHERTPAQATWENVVTELHIQAHHPRVGWDNQDFYYRLSYQRNGYDIRNAQVDVLRDRSSGMYTSTFGSTWSGQTHSRPTASVAEIVFNISGEWNPHGRGHVSWWGQLVLSAAKGDSSYQSFTVGSEQDWVWSV